MLCSGRNSGDSAAFGTSLSEERKFFFFEKKKQKTFANGVRGPIQSGPRAPISKSFLVLFFKKELLTFFLGGPFPKEDYR
jgi:hypothetical protein